jgi:hypothetical protein
MKRSVIRVTSTPPGEAPLWVRESWVGLELQAYGNKPSTCKTVGVASGPRSRLGIIWHLLRGRTSKTVGYVVESRIALSTLETRSPKAAAWFRDNAPLYLRPGSYFVFHGHSCTIVSEG